MSDTDNLIEYREAGRLWIAQISPEASEDVKKMGEQRLKQQAHYELHERPQRLKKINTFKRAKKNYDQVEKELLAQAESILGSWTVPLREHTSIEAMAGLAASNESITDFPAIFHPAAKDFVYKLRRELPRDTVLKYQEASKALTKAGTK